MARFLIRRLGLALLLLFLILTLVFFLLRRMPGSPVSQAEDSRLDPAQRARLIHAYGLDLPLPVQYARWLGAVARGNLGRSLSQQRPVGTALREAIPASLLLGLAALAVEYGLGIGLGLAAARRPGSGFDHALRIFGLILFSQPVFWLGLMAILLFAYQIPLFPASHMHSSGYQEMGAWRQLADLGHHLILPALVVGLARAGGTARFVRGRMLEVLRQDFIRTARAKGLTERRILWVHALRNVLGPVLQIFSLSLPAGITSAFLTEIVFAWPGLGRLTFNALLSRDYPLILATTGLSAGVVLLANLMADLGLAALDPRVRDA